MKNLIIIVFICLPNFFYSQQNVKNDLSYVEVVGTAKKEIEPNQIYILITLTEKSIDNKKYSINAQENKLNEILTELNISKNKLVLSDVISATIIQNRKEIGIKQSKEYSLILENAQQVSYFFEKLLDANIKEAEVIKIDHTDIAKYNKEVRIEAVKAAKDKAEYIVNAVGNKIGKPIEIIEENLDNTFFNRNNLYISNVVEDEINISSEFKKIIITFSYKVKYSIE